MTKAREIAELGQKLTVDASGNLDIAGTGTFDGVTVDGQTVISSGNYDPLYLRRTSTASTTLVMENSDNDGGAFQADSNGLRLYTRTSSSFDERVRLHANKNVIIYQNDGTTTGLQYDATNNQLDYYGDLTIHTHNNTAELFEFSGGTTNSILKVRDNNRLKIQGGTEDSEVDRLTIESNGDVNIYKDDGSTTGIFFDASTGAFGIGDSTANYVAGSRTTVNIGGNDQALLGFRTTTDNSGYIYGNSANFLFEAESGRDVKINAIGANNIILKTSNAERMRLLSDGALVIGGTSANTGSATTFHQDGTWRSVLASGTGGDSFMSAISGVSNGYQISVDSSNNQTYKWHTAATQSMTLDSSGKFLVGKTSDDNTANGLVVNGNGFTKIVRTSATANVNTVLQLNRQSSDGDIARFQNDGTKVGSIGARATQHLYIGSEDVGLLYQGDADAIEPWNPDNNNPRDNAIDLGLTSNRFKHLYLGGGVHLGGTGTANRLDDYEEGTWNPTCPTGTPTITGTATYVKIGKMVFIAADVQMPNQTNSSQAQIRGLPFTPYARGTNSEYNISPGEHTYGSYITLSLHNSYPAIVFRPSGGTSATYTVVSAKRFRFSGWYEVA